MGGVPPATRLSHDTDASTSIERRREATEAWSPAPVPRLHGPTGGRPSMARKRSFVMASSDVIANFPHDLRRAQEAIELPAVQDMIRRLSEYNLGVFMPHIHDEETGTFAPLPAGISQVEDGLQVSFRREDELVDEGNQTYVPVGWYWREGVAASMECVAYCVAAGSIHSPGVHVLGPGEREDEDEDELEIEEGEN